ncbi:MAG: DedA family protein [Blastocatellia bacterium]|nr:DedA family protein [Blastocatellia bacterium]
MIVALNIVYKAIKRNKLRSLLVLSAVLLIVAFVVIVSPMVHERLNTEVVEALIAKYGYYLIFALVMVGNMGVPVPEETTVIASGFAVQRGLLDYETVVAVCIFSAVVGDNIGYMIGKKGGRALILKYGKYIRVDDVRLRKFEGFFEKYGDKTVFFARFIAGLRFLAGPLSGAARMQFRRFFMFNALGAIVWVFVMTQLGYHFGNQLPRLLAIIGKANATIVIVVALVVGLIYYLRKRQQRQQTITKEES